MVVASILDAAAAAAIEAGKRDAGLAAAAASATPENIGEEKKGKKKSVAGPKTAELVYSKRVCVSVCLANVVLYDLSFFSLAGQPSSPFDSPPPSPSTPLGPCVCVCRQKLLFEGGEEAASRVSIYLQLKKKRRSLFLFLFPSLPSNTGAAATTTTTYIKRTEVLQQQLKGNMDQCLVVGSSSKAP